MSGDPTTSDASQREGATGPRKVCFEGHDGVGLVGDAWGDPAARPVLLLHGGGQTRHAWGDTAERLAESGWHALSLDLRGHGESDWHAEGHYAFTDFADDVRIVSDTFPTPPVLVGASLGGIASLVVAGEDSGEHASALILVDIALRMEADGLDRILAFMTENLEQGFANLEEAADSVARYRSHRTRPTDLSGLAKNLRLGPDGRYRWHWDPKFLLGRRRPGVRRQPERLIAAARGLRVPTLLVRGRMSDVVSEEGAREFVEVVPHARYCDVSGAGHMVAGDRNDVFTGAVLDFLGELPPG